MNSDRDITTKFVEDRKDKYELKIKGLEKQIELEKEEMELLYCEKQSIHWLELRKTIYDEYFEKLPRCLGILKGAKKERCIKMKKKIEFL